MFHMHPICGLHFKAIKQLTHMQYECSEFWKSSSLNEAGQKGNKLQTANTKEGLLAPKCQVC